MTVIPNNLPQSKIKIDKEEIVNNTNTSLITDKIKNSLFPYEIVGLASEGLFYNKQNPLSLGQIVMKYRTAKEEDILTSENLIEKGIVTDVLFKAMILSEINYEELLLGDKDGIMINVKILGDGKDYPLAKAICPKCKHVYKKDDFGGKPYIVNLSELKFKKFDKSQVINGNEFNFSFPYCKKQIKFKLLTIADDNLIAKELEVIEKAKTKIKQDDGIDREYSTRLKHMILSVDGDTNPLTIYNFVDNIISLDLKEFKKYVKSIAPGVDNTFTFVCTQPECGHVEEGMILPINSTFLWTNSPA